MLFFSCVVIMKHVIQWLNLVNLPLETIGIRNGHKSSFVHSIIHALNPLITHMH